jgi:3-deoxy-7-phosphoheptulonate synthase
LSRQYLTSREYQGHDSVIDVSGVKFGGDSPPVYIAGPCSVESEEQVIESAKIVKRCGAHMLRGGVFKARTSPYSFQGLGEVGLEYLKRAKEITGLPIVTEATSSANLQLIAENVDMVQVGSRNMQNFSFLKECGKINKPILLKRGFSASLSELLFAAEYIMSEGNPNVVLCERGIKTFSQDMRFTLDLGAVPVLKERTHLPIIVDPSHAAGLSRYVTPLSLAATSIGAHGLIVEVHHKPEAALCDGDQAVPEEVFYKLIKNVNKISTALNC